MRIIGQESVADMLGVSVKTVVVWQEQGLPAAKRGGGGVPSEYEASECVRWLIDREIARLNLERPRDRLLRSQADISELTLRKLRGELAPVAEVQRTLAAAIVNAREYLRVEPPRLSLLLEGLGRTQREAVLCTVFDNFLTHLSSWRPAGQDATTGIQP